MRIEQLLYLIKIAETGSFSDASKKLHVAQPSISQAIKLLESELGVKLLTRNYSGTTLTPMGREIIEHAQIIVSEIDNINRIANTASFQKNTHIKLVAGIVPISTFLPKAIEHLSPKTEEDSISIQEGSTQLAECLLERGEIDFAIVPYIDKPEASSKFNFTPLLDTHLMALVHKSSPLADNKALSLKDIQPYAITVGSEEYISSSYILQKIREFGEPRIALRTQNTALAMIYVQTAGAIGMVFDISFVSGLVRLDPNMLLCPIEPSLILTFGILSKKGQTLPFLAKNLIRQLKVEAKEWQETLNNAFHFGQFL